MRKILMSEICIISKITEECQDGRAMNDEKLEKKKQWKTKSV